MPSTNSVASGAPVNSHAVKARSNSGLSTLAPDSCSSCSAITSPADLTRAPGALAPEPPAMTDPAFVADAGLVLEPEFETLVGVGFSGWQSYGAANGASPAW